MKVRWTPEAAGDIAAIVDRVKADNPGAARRAASKILEGIDSLTSFPYAGRIGLVENTRELVFSPWPYIVVYKVRGRRSCWSESGTRRRTGHDQDLAIRLRRRRYQPRCINTAASQAGSNQFAVISSRPAARKTCRQMMMGPLARIRGVRVTII